MPKRVLVVDDHPAVALALKVFLRSDGRYEISDSARTAAEGLALLGDQDAVASALEALVEPSRAEEGVLVYIPNRDPEDPTKFFIYEQYVDEAAYTAHTETEHFKTHGFGDAIPRLQERKREFFAPMVD